MVNLLLDISLPRKRMARLIDRTTMTIDVDRGEQHNNDNIQYLHKRV